MLTNTECMHKDFLCIRSHPVRKIVRMARTEDLIAEELEADIVSGALPPGARLDEPSLAARFGVSRTPVRAALQRLSSSGLIELRPRATRVVEPSPVLLFEMFEAMAELEASCARLACSRADAAARDALQAALDACDHAAAGTDISAYYAANLDFHLALYAAAGNGFLARQAEALHLRLTPFRRQQLRMPLRVGQSLAEHHAIARAVFAGHAEAAAEAARAHLAVQGERFVALLGMMKSTAEPAAAT